MTTDIKTIINSVEIVGTDSGPRLSIDWPDKIVIGPDNAQDAMMLGQFIKATVKEMDMKTLCESHIEAVRLICKAEYKK
tara:strand:- start:528 stop:764 length:237 start_codon:yes stop_codon:yes gene_type:complete